MTATMLEQIAHNQLLSKTDITSAVVALFSLLGLFIGPDSAPSPPPTVMNLQPHQFAFGPAV